MPRITLDENTAGYAGFPTGFRIVARDDTGDPLAVDAKGNVWSFPHGSGTWDERSEAFESLEALHAYVAFQHNCDPATPEESLEALQTRKKLVQEFAKQHRKSRFVSTILPEIVAELRDEIADRKFWTTKQGRGLRARLQIGRQCEEALRAAGVPGQWMVRPHVDRDDAVMAVGHFAAPWTEAKVRALLQPLVGKYEIVCREAATPKA